MSESSPTATTDGLMVPKSSAHGRRRPPPIVYILLTALVLRLAAFVSLPHKDVWKSAAEMANIAKSLAEGHGFSSPFGQPTGPTAWVPPLYPWLLAAIFKLGGTFSSTSALLAFLFQIVVSSLTCIPILKLGEELGSAETGRWAGWGWACFPYFVILPVLFIWETALAAFLVSCLLWSTARLRRSTGIRPWALYSALWAFTALSDTAALALLPVCFGWLWWAKRHLAFTARLRGVVWLAFVFLVLVSPWFWRNWEVFHTVVPVRSNFGEELWLGNHEGGRGRLAYGENAYENPREMQRYRDLGEMEYVRLKRQAALRFMADYPGKSIRNILYRVLYWWLAVGEKGRIFWLYAGVGLITLVGVGTIICLRAGAWYLVAFSILVFPLTYYLADVMARYRHPIEPAMTLASAFFLYRAAGEFKRRTRHAAGL